MSGSRALIVRKGVLMPAPEPKCKRRRKPAKPYPSFPLTAHNNGQWCKKIRSKVHFFGVWEDTHAALDRYLQVAADLHAGREPHRTLSPDAVTVKNLCNHYLTYQLRRAEAGEISHRWFEDCRYVVENFASFVGEGRLASDLAPEDFLKYRQRLMRSGLGGRKGLGVHALIRVITVVRGLFKYAYEIDLIDKPIRYSKVFDRPGAALKRKNRRANELRNGKRLFEADEIRAMLHMADTPLRAMILLGINGGLGNTDCARLPIAAVSLDKAVLEFDRPKSGIERVVPLWPETVAALRQALAARPKPATDEVKGLVFLTTPGQSWVRENIHRTEDNRIRKVVPMDAITQAFDKVIRRLGLKRKGIGFYTLRHTFRTWADEVRDQHAIHRIMGHTIPGMSGIYIEEISIERLRAVVEHVRKKLFAEPQEPSAVAAPATT